MANYSLSISGAVGTGWEYAKKHGLVIAAILFIVYFACNALSSLFGVNMDMDEARRLGELIGKGDTEAASRIINAYTSSGTTVVSILSCLIDILLYVGLYNLGLGLLSGRFTSVSLAAFKLPLMTYVKYVCVEIIVGIISGFAMLLCVVPYFFVAPRLVFAPIYVIDNPEAGIFEAIKASWGMTKGNTLAMIGLYLALIGILIVGFLCCCVGAFFAAVVALFATVAAYYQLRGNW